MKIEEAVDIVKPHLTESRFEHTLRVAETAVNLADIFGGTRDKIELAAIFHDYAKYKPIEEMRQLIMERDELPDNLLNYHHELWHGPAASVLIDQKYGIADHKIKSAIFYHTTGKENMSRMDKIIFVADYIEPGRSFPGINEVREAAREDLDAASWMALRNTIQFLVSKKSTVYPDTFYAYNELTRKLNGGN
ncbi:bis(5'-nucleosyl)-tetraphosphatase (symmetrical) YqeK [Virgibacillus siamensis]|uniref:bis(5'-nucleosyl)-tetraphosphatase (symmetrical) YqeK n=1 Tax=Virgibacillus siamensis TaxID=480071 RepID=UPI000984C3AA|nr:bis(5'-nucleosyl)-tetraphosphatase (symmetrical) YqeK [Virgibacillus siamensis]